MTAPEQRPVLLALDSGSWETGWAVFQGEEVAATGLISPRRLKPGPSPQDRLAYLTGKLDELVARWRPQAVVVSRASEGVRWALPAMELVNQGLREWSLGRELPLHSYTDQEVRRSVVGRDRVSASQLAYGIMALLGVEGQGRTTREWEAVAAGYYHLANHG